MMEKKVVVGGVGLLAVGWVWLQQRQPANAGAGPAHATHHPTSNEEGNGNGNGSTRQCKCCKRSLLLAQFTPKQIKKQKACCIACSSQGGSNAEVVAAGAGGGGYGGGALKGTRGIYIRAAPPPKAASADMSATATVATVGDAGGTAAGAHSAKTYTHTDGTLTITLTLPQNQSEHPPTAPRQIRGQPGYKPRARVRGQGPKQAGPGQPNKGDKQAARQNQRQLDPNRPPAWQVEFVGYPTPPLPVLTAGIDLQHLQAAYPSRFNVRLQNQIEASYASRNALPSSRLDRKCTGCWMMLDKCFCASTAKLPAANRVLVYMHWRESCLRKASNTAKLVPLLLEGGGIVAAGDVAAEVRANR
jgi:hypothetical protein